ncbi:MAG: TAXI family TRAP transporter solute-binding subunit [Candidatus Eisenbacteria bacterium]|uniref:TAXI family TRAP transporter solute-binding subunit n=1 Tax=Eiseniibacteriota bacterium TaxID=2212470 RepID=A0A7Y2E8S2_UNCEI|nr:TAXI family TRAP transporter solute-binding subunit [Candidatus Eisenbacteria bacterium]
MFLSLSLALILCLPAQADSVSSEQSPPTPSETKIQLRLATGSHGGTFLPVGHDIANWLNANQTTFEVVVDTTAGSVDNLSRLIQGEADLAIVGSSPFRKVLEDQGRLALARGAQGLLVMGSLYDDAEQFVVKTSMVRANSMLDLNGLLMYPGPRNSGGEVDTRTVMQTLGVEPRYVYPVERTKGYLEAAEALARGDYDACTFSGGVPIIAVEKLFADHPGEFCILPFTRHQLSKVKHASLDFEPVTIPANSYPGLKNDLRSVGGPNLLITRGDLDPELLRLIDATIRAGIQDEREGLREKESHPVLQILTESHWDIVPEGVPALELGPRGGTEQPASRGRQAP